LNHAHSLLHPIVWWHAAHHTPGVVAGTLPNILRGRCGATLVCQERVGGCLTVPCVLPYAIKRWSSALCCTGQVCTLKLSSLNPPSYLCPVGTLPPSWSRLAALQDLRLSDCSLSGPLPPSWGALSKLKVCWLHRNKLTGPLPVAWSGMAALEDLQLSFNSLTGETIGRWGSAGRQCVCGDTASQVAGNSSNSNSSSSNSNCHACHILCGAC
jgi:hypothetical protein